MTTITLPPVSRKTVLYSSASSRDLRLVDQRTTGTNPTLHDDDETLARMIEANHDYMSVAYIHLSITE